VGIDHIDPGQLSLKLNRLAKVECARAVVRKGKRREKQHQ